MIIRFSKPFFSIIFLFLLQLVGAQQYPVQVTPVLIPPYSLKLGDYATTGENKLQLQLLMTDLMEPTHNVRLRFSLESGINATPIAVSNQYINGMRDITLSPGVPLILSNIDIRPLFQLQNLGGISAADYARTLPQGMYNFCFQVVDSNTGRTLSQKSCSTAYFVQYDPPILSLPQNGELVQKQNEIQNLVFQWMPRQLAPNTRYIFTLKEIWDTQRDPVTAFLSSPALYQEEVYSNSLFYGFDKTQLLVGKRYAWQVQAKSGNPVLGGNPTEDNGVYKNNGLSEIFYFDYIQDCKIPSFLSAKNAGRGRVEIRWSYPGEKPNSLYKVQYRKKGSTSAWMEQDAYQESAYITGLEDQTVYEYRVGSVCGLNTSFNNSFENGTTNAYSYSNIQHFTTDSSDKDNNYQCGLLPDSNITNQSPLQELLVANEIFTAGDFPVTVISAKGSNGNFTGEGYIVVPYLGNTKLKVVFNSIQINTERQLIGGVIETTYDPNESAIYTLSDLWSGFGDQNITNINIDYAIESVEYISTPPPGKIIVKGKPGENGEEGASQTYDGGKETKIVDSEGNIWEVDKDGNVTDGGKIAKGGASTSSNTEGISGSGKNSKVENYTAKGITLKWEELKDKTTYTFDTPSNSGLALSDYANVKDSKGEIVAVPYKLVVNGKKDVLQANVTITDEALKDAKIIFKTLKEGKEINAEENKVSATQRLYELELKGVYNYAEEEIIAVAMPIDSIGKQQIISSFNLVHIKNEKPKVYLVPLDKASKGRLEKIEKNIKTVYNKVGVDFEIVKEDVLYITDLGIGNTITSGDPKLMSTYGSDQVKINNYYLNKRSKELRYVVFVTEKSSSTGQAGYMRLNGQFGYVFGKAPIKTAAHELGHGVFKLEHPTSNSDKLLMGYGTGEFLSHLDWKQIGDPKFKLYAFQGQSEGELANGFGLSPNFDLFETDSNLILTYDDIKLEYGFVEGFINKGTDYYWDTTLEKYIDSNQNKYPFINTTPADNRFIWLVYNLDKECKERKFIRTLYRDVKDIIARKDKQALVGYIAEIDKINRPKEPKDTDIYSGYLGCDESKNRTNEELLQKANKIIEDKIKAQFPEKNITYSLLDKKDPDYEQKLVEAKKQASYIIATLEANGELTLDFSFGTPDWLLKLLPEGGKSNDTCAKEYVNKALKSLKENIAYKTAERSEQIAMEVGTATYYGFFGVLYCATNEESCKNSSSTVKFITGATHELVASVDVVQIVEGVVALIKGNALMTMKSYVDYYKNLETISRNQTVTPRQALEVILYPPANSSIVAVEKSIEVGDSFIKNYFTECDKNEDILKYDNSQNMCAYKYGEITVMVVPIVFTAGEWAITKVSALNKLKTLTKLSESLLEASIQLDRKLANKGVKLVDEGTGTVLIETKTGNRLTKIESKNQADIEKALDNLTGSHIDDLIKDYPNLRKWLDDPKLKEIFERDFGNASSELLKALDNKEAFNGWKNYRQNHATGILCN